MTPETVMTMGRHAMEVTLLVAAPLLLVAVSIFQAATQINESTLSFIPKLVGVFVALVVAGPWMISVMTDYMREIFGGIPGLVS
jgi:flagellar biosynthesis protein FliQ